MSKRVVLPDALRAIRTLRAATDPAFKLSQFATTCGMSAGHLCNVEKGRKQPTEDAIERIARELDVPVTAISYEISMEAAS